LFKILPDAFVFNYAGRDGELTKLTFKPNPNFQPPSLEDVFSTTWKER
jgi:hypothetical protein